jgi:hypothetical protein
LTINKEETMKFQGHASIFVNATMIQYYGSQHAYFTKNLALFYRGVNVFLCGGDMLVLEGTERILDVREMGGHCNEQISIVNVQTLISTHKGDDIAVFD